MVFPVILYMIAALVSMLIGPIEFSYAALICANVWMAAWAAKE